MATPFIRAKARDSVDALDNLVAYFDRDTRQEVVSYMIATFADLEQLMAEASASGADPIQAYRAFVTKFNEYWNAPPA